MLLKTTLEDSFGVFFCWFSTKNLHISEMSSMETKVIIIISQSDNQIGKGQISTLMKNHTMLQCFSLFQMIILYDYTT